mgnify:FL=1|tara:strand:- start:405 stop:797 length:393 start_codon:yes stop_codon:yes gene_type:complete
MKVIVFIIYFFPVLIFSQSKNNTFEIRNEKGIEYLVNKYENILKNTGGINGWRLQLKFKAKESEIIKIKLKFIKLFPNIPVFLEYQEPYYRIRVGNCRTKLEALKIKYLIKKHFTDTYPVPEIISITDLN